MQHFMLQIDQHTNDGTLHTSLIIASIKHEVRMDEFLRMAAGLKKIPRQGWIDKAGISNPESVADHSYSMTVMAMMFGDNAGMDTCKMIRMALLHDIVESITGDLTPEMTSKENKLAQEKIAIEKITRTLPEPLRTKYSELWSEYSAQKSAESVLVHEVDKLDMALQASIYAKEGTSSFQNLQVFFDSAKKSINNTEVKSMLDLFLKKLT